MRAVRKVEAIREDLGKVGPVIAEQVEEAMLGRRNRLDTRRAESEVEPIRKLFKFERDLEKQIRQLLDRLNDTKRELRLDPENVQKVVEVALELAGQPRLIETKVPGLWPDPKRSVCPVFRLPVLSDSLGALCRGAGAPIHGRGTALRLRSCLGERAGGCGTGSPEPPARPDVPAASACRGLVAGGSKEAAEPGHGPCRSRPALQHLAVVAHARLVVIGGDSQRLHEEIISAGGPIREGRFTRFGSLKEMHDALAAARDDEPSDAVKRKLTSLWRNISDPLHQALEARKSDRTDGLKKLLKDRADKEVEDITAILNELRRAIQGQLDDPFYRETYLPGFAPLEQEQFERNVDALRRRLTEIPGEIEKETEAIRKRFAEPQARMFPVAVTFMVPARLAREGR